MFPEKGKIYETQCKPDKAMFSLCHFISGFPVAESFFQGRFSFLSVNTQVKFNLQNM